MSRTSERRFVKPMLETLEARDQPSFVLSGAIQAQMQPQVDGLLKDMTAATVDLAKQVNSITTNNTSAAGPNVGTLGALTPAQAQGFYGKAVADYQRIWNDHSAITTTVATDTAFINAVAMAEFTEGDPIDLILVRFGSFFNINPTSGLTDTLKASDALWNNGQLNTTQLTTDINEDFSKLTFPNTTTPSAGYYIATAQTILQSGTKPTFTP